MKTIVCALFAALLFAGFAPGGETTGRELSPQDTDRAIDEVFNGAAGVTRMEADIITQKTGGMVKGSQLAYEFLRLETPAMLYLGWRSRENGGTG